MKKLLLFAGSLAVMVSCQKTETTPDAPQVPQSKGLVFAIEKGDNTKAEYQSDFYTNWNAETDRIGIFYKNAGLGLKGTGDINDATAYTAADEWIWSGAAMSPAEYKATTSGPRGYFTAIDDVNMLLWAKAPVQGVEEKPAEFAIYYPSSLTATASAAVGYKPIIALPALNTQTQKDEKGASCVATNVMVQMTAPIKRSDLAVGEAIPMKLNRLYTVLPLKIKNSAAYGALKSITVTAEKSNIATSDAGSYNFEKVTKNTDGTYNYAATGAMVPGATKVKEVKLTVDAAANGTMGWNEDATAYVTVLPVARKSVSEKMTATYEFANATFTQEWNVSADWTPNMFVASTPVLDCDKTPIFFSNDKTMLFINDAVGTAKLSSFFNKAADKILIGTDEVLFAAITTIASKATQIDLAGLEKFTALTQLQLANSEIKAAHTDKLVALTGFRGSKLTSIPTGAFAGITTLKELDAPEVTAIENGALPADQLETVLLPKYNYASTDAMNAIFSSKLKSVDMSSVTTISDVLALMVQKSKTSLVDLTISEGIELPAAMFNGFVKLVGIYKPMTEDETADEDVCASLNLMGENVFKGAEKLTEVKLVNSEVPAGSFEGCTALTAVHFVTAPSKVGKNAFKASGIEDIDLSNATEIGEGAFNGCTKLVGKKDATVNINALHVDKVTVLNNDVFKGCTTLKYVTFNSVTKVGNNFLASVIPGNLIFGSAFEFDKTVAGGTDTKIADGSFGTIAATNLVVSKDQKGVAGNVLTVTTKPFTFGSISAK